MLSYGSVSPLSDIADTVSASREKARVIKPSARLSENAFISNRVRGLSPESENA